MSQLLLVLWASTVFVELNRGLMANVVPAGNLSCFQCFKVPWADQCQPIECKPREKVCVSNEVLIYTSPVITKGCANSCPAFDHLFDWALGSVEKKPNITCCVGDFCNRAPKSLEGFGALLGRVLLTMGLGLFCTLLG